MMMQHACRHICEFSRQFVHTLRLLSASVMFFWSTRCADAGAQGVEGHRCAHMAHALSARTTAGGGVELGHVGTGVQQNILAALEGWADLLNSNCT